MIELGIAVESKEEVGANAPATAPPCVALSASFTVDPLCDSLTLLLHESGIDLPVAVTPYGQVFQTLLDPGSLFARNKGGINVVLVRLEDWVRDAAPGGDDGRATIERNAADLVATLTHAAASSPAPLVVCVCPASRRLSAEPSMRAFLDGREQEMVAQLRRVPPLRVLTRENLGPFDAETIDDEQGDRLGHVPYKPLFFATLGLAVARLVHALKSSPHKVLVLDCDNTLWRGVVAEDGVDGIEITPPYRALQTFVRGKRDAGMIVCLASKNVESDVAAVLERRPDMVLRADDIVAMKVNWLPKSENIRALAAELNLGLDSFVVIDDNPLECAEIEAACPGVLAVRLPVEDDFPRFLSNIWALDQLDVTDEDRQRTALYRQNLERDHFQKAAGSLADFVVGLDLRIDLGAPREDQIPRVAQLTQRTNQFNFTTRRRNEGEIRQLAGEGQQCLRVEVQDRFGDYGLVGLMIFGAKEDALEVDSLLLSCRVLGRGVEHAMMRELGQRAKAQGLARVAVRFLPTKRNIPARQFLDSLVADAREESESATSYLFASERLAELTYLPGASTIAVPLEDSTSKPAPRAGAPSEGVAKSVRWNRVARELDTPAKVLAEVTLAGRRARVAAGRIEAPRNAMERHLAAIWAETLNVREVGIHDDFFELGGTSLLAVTVFARIERELGKRFGLAILVDCPTVALLAARFDQPRESGSIVPLHVSEGDAPPVFLVHDADGETLLYRNLAKRLGARRSVYGIRPFGRDDTPCVHTRIEEMAAYYVRQVRRIRPHGPYLLGGLCAGGVVAFEMARQLEETNERAHLVALFDAADVAAAPAHRVAERRVGSLRELVRTRPLHELPGALLGKARNLARYELDVRVRRRKDAIAVATMRFCLNNGLSLPSWARDLPIRTIYMHAEAAYRPKGRVREEIVLFRATEGEGTEEPYIHRYLDPLLGWGHRTAKGVKVADVPGGHGTMLQEPNVKVIAETMGAALDAEDGLPTLRSVPRDARIRLTSVPNAS